MPLVWWITLLNLTLLGAFFESDVILQARNEELARKASKTSEEDVKLLTDEFEARVGAAERKVYALSKERDMLRRNAEKLNSATDLVKEKDNIIAQVQTLLFNILEERKAISY